MAAPLQQDALKDEEELSFDDLNDDDDETVPKPEKTDTKLETYIQKIPRRNHIKAGEELNKCLTEDPAKGHPHLIKTDIQDVAEVLITHTKNKPEHIHKFGDLPEEVQKDLSKEEPTEASTTKKTSDVDDGPKLPKFSLDRKKREERPTKVRLPKLKLTEKKRDHPASLKKVEKDTEKPETDDDKPKPEPISIPLHEVAGFEKLKKKVKRDTDSLIVKRSSFVRPKPVSEILKHHAIQSTNHHKKDE